MQKRNIPTDRAQRIDEKNGIIFLAIMFTPRVKVIKMSKIAHFLFYTVWARYLSAPERSYWVLSFYFYSIEILWYG